MTDDITIMMNEVNNDGRKIHLYFNPSFGQYVAYGISGYVASKIGNIVEYLYDEDIQMPMVKIDDRQLNLLGIADNPAIKEKREYVRLTAFRPFNQAEYIKWATQLRDQYKGIVI